MAKKVDVTLIIAKSFSNQYLDEKECELCKDLDLKNLINVYGLNDIQASKVINWCIISQRKIQNQQNDKLKED